MLIIGLISGTSADAIDAALVRFPPDTAVPQPEVVAYCEQPYPADVQQRLERLLADAAGGPAEICELHVLIGQAFAAAAHAVVAQAGYTMHQIDLIASHGQTIYHQVQPGRVRSTLQLGAAAEIAERTGCTVVSDFRSRDIAAGGEGAPLAPLLDTLVLAHPDRDRVLVNIGGIANLTYVPAGDPAAAIAFDTGPGNTLIDGAVRRFSQGVDWFDRNGTLAAAGKVDDDLLRQWLADPYYARPAPKSTGREQF
ncbi:MAG TPA: anhydro-N-acetylmuramic acid kinase, partial [Roseiflexaceae bacterium]|nr:anhydro-N-acetylmuramic acid kinase [Roseiflexaceae bacterium]